MLFLSESSWKEWSSLRSSSSSCGSRVRAGLPSFRWRRSLVMRATSALASFVAAACLAFAGRESLFHGGDIRQNEFRVDDVNVAQRIHGTEFMDNIIIVKAADYLHDGVHFTDVRQKLVAQAGSFRGSLTRPAISTNSISVGMIFSEPTCRKEPAGGDPGLLPYPRSDQWCRRDSWPPGPCASGDRIE